MSRRRIYEDMLDRARLFRQWMVRLLLGGAALFVVLGIVDYFGVPDRFAEFLWYRVQTAVLLAVLAFISDGYAKKSNAFHERIGVLAVAASAATVEIMVMRSGGHASPYYVGHILLAVCAVGFVPARLNLHILNAVLIYCIYLLPILLLDRIEEERRFVIQNGFLVSAIVTTLVLRALTERALDRADVFRRELERSENKYRDLFENAVEPIFVVDEHFHYVDANRKAEDLTGFSREELLSFSIFDMIPDDQVPRSTEELQKLRSRGSYERFEGKLRTKDGRWLDVEISSSAITRNGRFAGSRDVVSDISERKRYQEEVRRTREELEERVRERTAALSDMNALLQGEIVVRRSVEKKVVEQLERQRALSTVERSIASSLNLSVTLNVFMEQVMSQLRPDAAAVMLYDRENQELSFAAERGFRSDRIMRVTVRTGQSLAGTVISKQSALQIADLGDADRLYPLPEGYSFKDSFLVRDEGFRAYIGVPLTVKGQVKGILEVFHRRVFEPERDWSEFLEALSQQASIAIDNASLYEALQRSHAEISMAYDKTIEGWSRALDIRDNETHGHSHRVAELAVHVARRLGIGDGELVHIRRGALLHDIGKLGVPDSILLKPGKLSVEEMTIMKRHPEIAFDILAPIPFLKDALDIPYLHHEKWDGTGYPRGLRGVDIPVAARIFSVIDVWDALRSDRPYRIAWDEKRIENYLEGEQGRHFDPEIIGVFLQVMNEKRD